MRKNAWKMRRGYSHQRSVHKEGIGEFGRNFRRKQRFREEKWFNYQKKEEEEK